MRRRPGLYRAARDVRIAATVFAVLIVVFLGSVALFASEIRPSWGASPFSGFSQGPNETAVASGQIWIANPGEYAIDSLSISTVVLFPGTHGPVVALGGAPSQRIPGGGTTVVGLSLTIPLSTGVGEPLLTENLVLPSETWVNLTYATLFPLRLGLDENLTWGAPFEGLAVDPGTPQSEPNGTYEVPVDLSFNDDAEYSDDGTIGVRVNDPSGVQCGQGVIAIDVDSHAAYDAQFTTYVGSACLASGSTVVLTFQGGPWAISLPPEGFP